MPIHITTQKSGEVCLRPLPTDTAPGAIFPDTGILRLSGCFSTFLFYDQACPDFCIRLGSYLIGPDKGWPAGKDDKPLLLLQFVLKNSLDFTLDKTNRFHLSEGQFNLITSPSVDRINWYDPANIQTATLDIYLSRDYIQRCSTDLPALSRLLDALDQKRAAVMTETPVALNSIVLHFLNAIMTCPYAGEFRRFYIQTKVLLLLVMASDQIFSQPAQNATTIQLNKYELEKIYEARQYMRQHIENPPTLKELARKMGINDFKLKKAYKQVFNTTIFDDFNHYRMEKAKRSLLETDLSIADISLSTGYEDPPNFIRAFKKYVGIAPSIFRKQHGHQS